MIDKHILYGAEFSLYSGKARSYLRYKRIPFDEVLSTIKVYRNTIIPQTGVRFIPVVRIPDGEYLQDTSHIIDTLETGYPQRSVMPEGPRQRVAAHLLEIYGDDWLLIPAMHYRWNHDNFPFIFDEFGRTLFPHWPKLIRRYLGRRVSKRFRGFLPTLGITDITQPAIENWYEKQFLPALNRHFEQYDYLFGGRPSIGDFGLFGALYAHLYRDPYPGALMRRDAPQVANWVERMLQPGDECGEWLADDQVPATLNPIFESMFADHWPVLAATADRLSEWVRDNEGPAIPRRIGEHRFSIAGVNDTRAVLPYSVWKMQRPLDEYASLNDNERDKVDSFLQQVGGISALRNPPSLRLTRVNNQLVLAE